LIGQSINLQLSQFIPEGYKICHLLHGWVIVWLKAITPASGVSFQNTRVDDLPDIDRWSLYQH